MSSLQSLAEPSRQELMAIYNGKYFREGEPGWSPRMRLRCDYFSPDDVYEALVARLVTVGCDWADVGCGRNIFPQNPQLERALAERCGYLLGIDPDDNIKDNPLLSDSFQGLVDDCAWPRQFDVVTLRMVAEHITNPDRALSSISRLLKPGGHVVIYTPNKWAPVSIVAALTPFWMHHPVKRVLWGGEARDTFPTAFKLNTRKTLQSHGQEHGLEEVFFKLLDDCRVLARFRALNYVELKLRGLLNSVGLHYPENCILAVYRKRS